MQIAALGLETMRSSRSRLLLCVVGVLAPLAPAATTINTTTFLVRGSGDLLLSGGAGVQAAPLLSLRSGNPGGIATAAVAVPLAPGATIERVSLAYRYDTGYGPTGVGANFTLRVAGQPVYASPALTDFSYSHDRSNYSQPVVVDAAALILSMDVVVSLFATSWQIL